MSSNASPSSNVGAAPGAASTGGETAEAGNVVLLVGRCTEADRYIVDRAAVELNVSRSRLVVDAAVERARAILAEKGVTL